jgi:hypothetical protein
MCSFKQEIQMECEICATVQLRVRGKLLMANPGEVAEWLKAAVC